MNCTTCFETIDKSKGYYLVKGTAYCTNCYQEPAEAIEMMGKLHSSTDRWGSENLLEAFRQYQRRDQKMVFRVW